MTLTTAVPTIEGSHRSSHEPGLIAMTNRLASQRRCIISIVFEGTRPLSPHSFPAHMSPTPRRYFKVPGNCASRNLVYTPYLSFKTTVLKFSSCTPSPSSPPPTPLLVLPPLVSPPPTGDALAASSSRGDRQIPAKPWVGGICGRLTVGFGWISDFDLCC